jgi:alpha-beta hydrolase superfamily lysophospholipase
MKKWFKWSLYGCLLFFLLMNFVAAFHAYKFTHFAGSNSLKTKSPGSLSFAQRAVPLLLGVSNPRPKNIELPGRNYETIKLQSNKLIECWSIQADTPKGVVIIFHGYSGCKSAMLDKANEFLELGFSTLLVDFMGSGGSDGDQTTIGYKEADEVKTCYDYAQKTGAGKVFLFGTSMGAAAILKSIYDFHLKPAGIIIECPFGTMYETTCARFRQMELPVFPMAGLLDFWGGVENDFNAFSLCPQEYAKSVESPTLLLYGGADKDVSRKETNAIYNNLQGYKQLKIYPLATHENYLIKYKPEWVQDVSGFLKNI